MKHAKAFALMAAALVMLVGAPSNAQQLAYVSTEVNLRAGPSGDFPVVAILGGGVAITVEGCLGDYRWCDVSVGPHRGWLYAANIVYPYQGNHVPLLSYGAAIGIDVIGFSVGSYWDDYYRARSWYPQRQRWIDRPHPAHFGHPGHPGHLGYSGHPGHPAFSGQFREQFPGQSVFRPGFAQPPHAFIPAPRLPHQPHRSRPGFDHRPPEAYAPHPGLNHGHPPGAQGHAATPKPHQGMRRTESQRPGHGAGAGRQP